VPGSPCLNRRFRITCPLHFLGKKSWRCPAILWKMVLTLILTLKLR
jgi:hypothetical protein